MAQNEDTIIVDDKGTALSFTDSGSPGTADYTTIFGVHGLGFNNAIFRRIQACSSAHNTRFIAVNRRQYRGSSPLTEAEANLVFAGSDGEKAETLDSFGVELANFIALFIQKHDLPPLSQDRKRSGIAILGWSAGCTVTGAAIANIDKLPSETQALFKAHLRAYILYEPPSLALGLPISSLDWVPLADTTVPENKRVAMFTSWVTSYFDHPDLSSRDIKQIEYIVPSPSRRPSIYDMTKDELDQILEEAPVPEAAVMFMTAAQANLIYRKACFTQTAIPHLRRTFIAGSRTASFALAAMWLTEDDNKALGGNLEFVLIPGANHFEDPEQALKAFLNAL
ncbi:hypothetical protein C8J56DRAFT_1093544 [Mycena floridula]|nr:hypothetical protein C8J56DRAFT_1093544 [Mycena floridula]